MKIRKDFGESIVIDMSVYEAYSPDQYRFGQGISRVKDILEKALRDIEGLEKPKYYINDGEILFFRVMNREKLGSPVAYFYSRTDAEVFVEIKNAEI